MFQTEFCGSDYKFVISWDSDATHLYGADQSIDNDQNLFYKLNELYDNISKFTTGSHISYSFVIREIDVTIVWIMFIYRIRGLR